MLTEIAPGIDLQNQILDKMDFTPIISPDIKVMDEALFNVGIVGMRETMMG